MNKNMETFVSEVKSRKARQHRILSLLLSLSLVVTSGVSWALRGVGLTLANEAECGTEEHIHTDECYEQTLICGLEEDTEHAHDETCYEERLICGLDEHVHDASCFADIVTQPAVEPAAVQDDIGVVIGGITDAEGNPVRIAAAISTTAQTAAVMMICFFMLYLPSPDPSVQRCCRNCRY